MYHGNVHDKTGVCLYEPCGQPTDGLYCCAKHGELYRASLRQRRQRKPRPVSELKALPRHPQAWYDAKIDEIARRNETGSTVDVVRSYHVPYAGKIVCKRVG